MYTALLNNQVPKNWEAAAYPSLKPLASWVKDFHARIAFMRIWLVNGQPGVFWMSGFFFPQVRAGFVCRMASSPRCPLAFMFFRDWAHLHAQGFTTGTLQNHARKYQVAIDTLSFGFSMLEVDDVEDVAPEAVPEDGVLVYGLFMDGARWDKERRMLGTTLCVVGL
jgi:dynein heavy chain